MDLSRYRLEALRQEHGLVLYRGSSPETGGNVLVLAPESLDPDSGSLRRLEHEYALANELGFDTVVKPLALTRLDGRAMLVLVDSGGLPLSGRVGKPLDIEVSLRLAVELVAAVRQVHARGLIHNDIKPANVIVDDSGRVSLTGFGIAARVPQGRPVDFSHLAAGTPEYVAPEQTGRIKRYADARSDLYSLGVTLYEMFAGKLPFVAADRDEWIHCHIARQPISLEERVNGIPQPLEAIILKLLAKRAEERYQTAAGLEADLQRCLDSWLSNSRIEEFAIGANDRPDRLVIPEGLYGRASQIETISAAFDRVVSRGTTGVVLVSGPGGIGKSSIVEDFRKSLGGRGLFASGKFDQYRRDVPYDTIAQAFKELVRRVIGLERSEMERCRAELKEALGPNGQLIVNLVPELVHVIGEQSPAPELPPQDSRNRFHLVFRRFLSVFARPERPLALFIDDVQWLDLATIELIERLAGEPEVRNLLLICAYRDNEVRVEHRFAQTLKTMRASNDRLDEVRVAPLTADVVARLIADTLDAASSTIMPLAELVFGKTEGNPFFVVQFLGALEEEGLLTFDRDADAWRWDVSRIGAKAITDNVADLIAEKMTRLSNSALEALKHLACLGSGASLGTLSTVLDSSESETTSALWECIRARFVLHADDVFALTHDRVQEAAYLLIPNGELAATHLRIGRALISKFGEAERNERIFEIADHFSRGVSLVIARDERELVARLLRQAGMRAKTSTAYASALRYFQTGRELLGPHGWESQYRLAFDLEIEQAECEFLNGEHGAAEDKLSALSRKARDLIDLAAVTRLRLALYTVGDPDRAVLVGLAYLRNVGIDWSPHPTEEILKDEMQTMRRLIDGRAIETFVYLPRMTNPEWLAAMDVLASLLLPALMTDNNLEDLVLVRMANVSLQHGNCDASCYAYSMLHVVLGLRFGDHQAGYRFGQLGCDLVDSHGLSRFKARVYSCFSSHSAPWTKHLRSCLPRTRQAIETANAVGDLVFAAATSRAMVENLLISGEALAEVQREAEQFLALSRKVGFEVAADGAIIQLLLVRELQGIGEDEGPIDAILPDRQSFERHLEEGGASLVLPLAWYLIRQVQARYLALDYLGAIDAISRLGGILNATRSLFDICEYHFYGALVHAAACDFGGPDERRQHLLSLAAHHRQIALWADSCPANFGTRAALVGAEIARLENREIDAQRLYEEAVRLAKEHGFIQNEAMANELAGRFYSSRDLETNAEAYLRNARSCYLRWGAHAKVRQLDQLYPKVKERSTARLKAADGTLLEELDLAAIMKMSQALSGEIILEQLIERLMVTVVEHAGAVRGLLLLRKEGEMGIAAEAVTTRQGVTVDVRQHQDISGELPESLLNYVVRAQEAIIVDDALEAKSYCSDPYIVSRRSRSILCLPLGRQQDVIGVLYLENNLASHLFTEGQAAVLRLVASQAAISLENADLFRDARHAQERARRAADELRMFFDTMPALAWTSSPNGAFEYGSKRWHDYTGIPLEAAQGDGWGRAFHPDDLGKVREKWRELVELGVAGEIEGRMLAADGSARTFLLQARPVRDDEGAIVRWYGTNTDIDELKRAEEAQAALARASRVMALGELTVSIAHEVNQPLMSIVTNAATALRWLDDDRVNVREARRATERIVRDGHRVGDIINSIRSMAKKARPRMEQLKINELVMEVIALMRDQLSSRELTVNLSLATDAGSVLGDRTQLQQVILNLVLNGIEAIEASNAQLRVLTIASSRAGSGASVTVSDTGVGLDKENQEKAFEAFFTTKPEGLGMGLSICRSIVEGHGGQMWVSSNQPRGSSFHFTLPGVSQEARHANPN